MSSPGREVCRAVYQRGEHGELGSASIGGAGGGAKVTEPQFFRAGLGPAIGWARSSPFHFRN